MPLSAHWRLLVDPDVAKAAKRFPAKDRRRIASAVTEMRFNPYAGDVLKLEGGEAWRRRIGAYRVFFVIDQAERLILVFRIERRGSRTY